MRNSVTGRLSVALSAGVFAAAMAGPAWALDTQSTIQDPAGSSTIPMGVSTSPRTVNLKMPYIYCIAGTLGAVVTDGTNEYVISNNHIFAKENENLNYPKPDGMDNRTVMQAGMLDIIPDGTGCTTNLANTVSPPPNGIAILDLNDYVPIVFKGKTANHVDVAMARIQVPGEDIGIRPGNEGPNYINTSGYVLGIGRVGGAITVADIQAARAGGDGHAGYVQKTGRTTQHRFGAITAVDGTIKVQYQSGTATFENQIQIKGCGQPFSDSGDSGSLILTVPDGTSAATQSTHGNALAVGLLFAGDSTSTWANQMIDSDTDPTAISVLGALTAQHNSGTVSLVVGIDGAVSGAKYADGLNAVIGNCPTPVGASSGGGGGGSGGGGGGGGHGGNPNKPNKGAGAAGLDRARDVKKAHSNEIFGLANVVGHAISTDADGKPVIDIYISKESAGSHYPAQIDGVGVRVIESGPIKAY